MAGCEFRLQTIAPIGSVKPSKQVHMTSHNNSTHNSQPKGRVKYVNALTRRGMRFPEMLPKKQEVTSLLLDQYRMTGRIPERALTGITAPLFSFLPQRPW